MMLVTGADTSFPFRPSPFTLSEMLLAMIDAAVIMNFVEVPF